MSHPIQQRIIKTAIPGPDHAYNPRTGTATQSVDRTSATDLDEAVRDAAAAAGALAATSPADRRTWLHAAADALETASDELVELADAETALGEARLRGEVARTAGQIRFYAGVAADGAFLGARIDPATEGAPFMARTNVPLGPVAVFGASNFPFAFSVFGNDTASAIAAGCPVVVKAHPAHPHLSRRVFDVTREAMVLAGAPDGVLGLVFGHDAGVALVTHPEVAAVAFTGSQAGGMSLWRLANQRETVIPVYAEMGTVNPVVVTPAAGADIESIAQGFVTSFTLGNGQFCTKPGLVLAPRGSGAPHAVAAAFDSAAVQPIMLTEGIARSVVAGVSELVAAGATVVAETSGTGAGWSAPAVVLSAPFSALHEGSRVLEECFGPVAVVVEYDHIEEALEAIDRLQGALAGSIMAVDDDPDAAAVIDRLHRKVGRVIVNDWPTGVAFTWAQHHGGPWPATSHPATTSVGASALDRFVRPVAFQGVPDRLLPAPLQAGNPWSIARRIGGAPVPAEAS